LEVDIDRPIRANAAREWTTQMTLIDEIFGQARSLEHVIDRNMPVVSEIADT